MAKDNIHKHHRERVREQYRLAGMDAMSDHQVLELLLYFVFAQQDTNALAHALLNEFGSLSAVFDADRTALLAVDGVGPQSVNIIKMIPEIARRYMIDRITDKRPILNNSERAGEYLSALYMGHTRETMYMLCLNGKFELIRSIKLVEGTIDQVPLHPRRVLEEALKSDTKSLILAHNHPSGILRPSPKDVELTQKIMAALTPVGIQLVDHIIVTTSGFFSFVQNDVFQRGIVDNPSGLYAADLEE